MAETALKGNKVTTNGELPSVGSPAKDFVLVAEDLSEKKLADFSGKKKLLNILPSLDTGVCATSTRKFNEDVGGRDDTAVLIISRDLPFAMKRFCEAEGIKNVISLSDFRGSFAADYGVEMTDGALKGLTARAVVVLDADDKVVYTELVPEITQEPDYKSAIAALG